MPLSPQAQAVTDAFTATLTPDQRSNFNAAIQNAPALVGQINAALASGDLRSFALLPPGTNAGGQYNPSSRAIELPASILTSPAAPARFDPAELVFVTGHEVQHAVNRPAQQAATDALVQEANRIGRSPQIAHDYTAAISERISAHRQDEASAHIAGINATVSMLRTANPNQLPSLEDLHRANPDRMGDFIAVTPGNPPSYAMRGGMRLEPDMSLAPNAANLEATARLYFDQPGSSTRIGPNGNSDYANYYATNWVGYVAQVERANAPAHAAAGRAPELRLDLGRLGITEAQIESNGLNLGAARGRHPYLDTTTSPPTPGHFDHTRGVNQHVPITTPDVALPMDHPESPDHALYRGGRAAVERMEQGLGRAYDGNSERLARAVTVLARENGLDRIDHVLLSADNGRDVRAGQNLFVVQGRVDDPAHLRACMRTDEALARSPANNESLLAEMRSAQQAREQSEAMDRQQTAQRDTAARTLV